MTAPWVSPDGTGRKFNDRSGMPSRALRCSFRHRQPGVGCGRDGGAADRVLAGGGRASAAVL